MSRPLKHKLCRNGWRVKSKETAYSDSFRAFTSLSSVCLCKK